MTDATVELFDTTELTGMHIPENDTFLPSEKDKVKPTKVNATDEVYRELQMVYDDFNQHLFGGELPGALIVMTRKGRSFGHYSPGRYTNRVGQFADEISLNPEYFPVRAVEEILSTLAHEMVHQWQFHFGNDVRMGYHDKEFAGKMREIGLITSNTGYPGGDPVGEQMTHYIAEDGPYILRVRELLKSTFGIIWYDRYPKSYLRRSPNFDDIKRAEEERKEIEEEKKRLLEELGKKPSGRGRKKTPVLQVQPAHVSKPAILAVEPVASAIGAELVEVEPEQIAATKIAVRLVKRQEIRAKSGKRTKYCCPSCQDSVWGKEGLILICGREGCEHARLDPASK
jgi:predicted SprT family Zn-dependent metalloprotease